MYEATIAERLNHPNVVRLLDAVSVDGGVLYLVYERAHHSLEHKLKASAKDGLELPITGFVADGDEGCAFGVELRAFAWSLPRRCEAT